MTKNAFPLTRILKPGFLIFLGLMLMACAPEPEVKDVQASEAEIEYLFDRWNNALQTGDSATVTAYYANDAVLLPTLSNTIRTDHDGIRDYFDYFLVLQPNGRIDKQHISINGNVAINTGIYTFTLTKQEHEKKVQARYSFVYERQNDGEWLIVNHHSSAMPEEIVEKPELMEDILIEEKS
ncbi:MULTISPECIES: SgcJ/EcaC family oxidoreductase [unclassified Methylophaga]|jgi:uncharacterized protein (TIGR02246 family)|uniref:SgcJ/EcaC family oxidoreductase n=1 Tax=unclassified Methylophaga TaxID=2629249 RepID=UPI000C94C5AA|nr:MULTISPECIES: SgcJ/EcaC family oxidoreductase [unclassified Methylophaga]MAK66374.1 DUF4440 domain-containing protein [Methylophaga sp.]MAY17068.1 DUF4440 domain-containing protein [Methylophaga sp.]HAO26141.1 DUF4440 domain-containing protein [Methylophaga sp.]HCD06289.1 DUF4440 domain-containing protein [Methylophaga sp.]|tara:strand:+ start:8525 stop:9067 length:543 start_codon:yes stop_codon:yes gene_type:complete